PGAAAGIAAPGGAWGAPIIVPGSRSGARRAPTGAGPRRRRMSHRHTRTPLLAVAALASLLAFVAPDARAQAVAGATALDRLGGLYGAAVALDGELAVVGAPTESPGGAAYVYRSGADGWQLEARLEAPDAATGAFFGGAVAVDGERVAVGAWGAERAYLFRHAASGWALEASLSSSGAGTGTRFGAALALAGERLAVAATSQGRPPEPETGAAA